MPSQELTDIRPGVKHAERSGKSNDNNDDEIDMLLRRLSDAPANYRTNILDNMLRTLKATGRRALPTREPLVLYQALGMLLQDNDTEVRSRAIHIVRELFSVADSSPDVYGGVILPNLIKCIDQATLRRHTIHCLHLYLKTAGDFPAVLRAIVRLGADNENISVQREVCIALPLLLNTEMIRQRDLTEIVGCLAKKLLSRDEVLCSAALKALESIRSMMGDELFGRYVDHLSVPLRKYVYRVIGTGQVVPAGTIGPPSSASTMASNGASNQRAVDTPGSIISLPSSESTAVGAAVHPPPPPVGRPMMGATPEASASLLASPLDPGMHGGGKESLVFGIVPKTLMDQLDDDVDFSLREKAMLHLIRLVRTNDQIENLVPYLNPFLSFLLSLLDNSSLKIASGVVETLTTVISRLGTRVRPFYSTLINTLVPRVSDSLVLRLGVTKLIILLMQILSPQLLVAQICECLSHRNSRVRQEVLNLIMAALLTFPSVDFDLPRLCYVVAHLLVDAKRQVRHAALECLALVAQGLGAGNLNPLVHAIDQLEISGRGEGLMSAVQARLARRQLPRLDANGMVEYATPVPSSAALRSRPNAMNSADSAWVLYAGSTRRNKTEMQDLEGNSNNNNNSSPSIPVASRPQQEQVPPQPKQQPPAPPVVHREQGPMGYQQIAQLNHQRQQQQQQAQRQQPPQQQPTQQQSQQPPQQQTQPQPQQQMPQQSTSPQKPQNQPPPPNRIPRAEKSNSVRSDIPVPVTNENSTIPGKPFSKSSDPIIIKPRRSMGRDEIVNIPNTNNSYVGQYQKVMKIEELQARLHPEPAPPGRYRPAEPITGHSHPPPRPITNNVVTGLEAAGKAMADFDSKIDSIDTHRLLGAGRSQRRLEPLNGTGNGTGDERNGAAHNKNNHPLQNGINGSSIPVKDNSTSSTNVNKKIEKISDVSKVPTLKSERRSPKANVLNQASGFAGLPSHPQISTVVPKKRMTRIPPPPPPPPVPLQNMHPVPPQNMHPLPQPPSSYEPYARHFNLDDVDSGVLSEPMSRSLSISAASEEPDIGDCEMSTSLASIRSSASKKKAEKVVEEKIHRIEHQIAKIASRKPEVPPGDLDTIKAIEKARSSGSLNDMKKMGLPNRYVNHSDDIIISNTRTESNRASTRSTPGQSDYATIPPRKAIARVESNPEINEKQMKKEYKPKPKPMVSQSDAYYNQNSGDQPTYRSIHAKARSPMGASMTKESPPEAGRSELNTNAGEGDKPETEEAKPPQNSRSGSIKRFRPPPNVAKSRRERTSHDGGNVSASDLSVAGILDLIANEDWQAKCEGLSALRQTIPNPEINNNLHDILMAVSKEVKNLRSQVSRLAIQTLGDMYKTLKRDMDTDLDRVVPILLQKTSESNSFIRQDVDAALSQMANNVTAHRAALALVLGGGQHKSAIVRKTAAHNLSLACDRIGKDRLLNGPKDINEKVLPAIAQFALDGHPETRYHGRSIVVSLMDDEAFEKTMSRCLTDTAWRNLRDVIETLRIKGLGPCPASSASSYHSEPSSAYSSNPSSAHGAKYRPAYMSDALTEDIKQMCERLSANDWETRLQAVSEFMEWCSSSPDIVVQHSTKLLDKFAPRFSDSNLKVNLCALQSGQNTAFIRVLQHPSCAAIIRMTVQHISQNLASKNQELVQAASTLLDLFTTELDGGPLLQAYIMAVSSGSARIKPEMMKKVTTLCETLCQRRPKLVSKYVLPELWRQLNTIATGGSPNPNLRDAVQGLVSTLYFHLGEDIIDIARGEISNSEKVINLLTEMTQS